MESMGRWEPPSWDGVENYIPPMLSRFLSSSPNVADRLASTPPSRPAPESATVNPSEEKSLVLGNWALDPSSSHDRTRSADQQMCYSDDVPTGTLERDHCTDWATSQNVAVKVDGPCPLPLAPWIPRTLSEVPKGSRHYTGVNESRHEIKIAIICALTLEADAIHALFDEHWHGTISTQMRSPGDTNSYSFGVICG